jgi:predicted nuclease of restriction endonuclease-like RecB superfamily
MTTPDEHPGVVRWSTDSAIRHVERQAIIETRDFWRRAYENRPPTSRERALASLLPLLTELVTATDTPARLSRAA